MKIEQVKYNFDCEKSFVKTFFYNVISNLMTRHRKSGLISNKCYKKKRTQSQTKADIIDFKAQQAAQRAKDFYASKANYIAQSKQGLKYGVGDDC